MTHSVFKEMLLLSPHCSLNFPDQLLSSPPLQLFLLHGVALSDRTYLPSQTPPEGWKTRGETRTVTKQTQKKVHLISLSASPTLGCGINTGKYLFIITQHPNICFSWSHGHTLTWSLPARCLPSQRAWARFCEPRRGGKRPLLKDFL